MSVAVQSKIYTPQHDSHFLLEDYYIFEWQSIATFEISQAECLSVTNKI